MALPPKFAGQKLVLGTSPTQAIRKNTTYIPLKTFTLLTRLRYCGDVYVRIYDRKGDELISRQTWIMFVRSRQRYVLCFL